MRYLISRYLICAGLLLNVNIAQTASHHPQDFLKQIAGSSDEGEQIVQHYCANCHAVKPLIPLGAPRIAYASDWDIRIKPGLNALFVHTDEGLNAMPARGGCFECTDKQLLLAIFAMLPAKAKKSMVDELKEHNRYK